MQRCGVGGVAGDGGACGGAGKHLAWLSASSYFFLICVGGAVSG